MDPMCEVTVKQETNFSEMESEFEYVPMNDPRVRVKSEMVEPEVDVKPVTNCVSREESELRISPENDPLSDILIRRPKLEITPQQRTISDSTKLESQAESIVCEVDIIEEITVDVKFEAREQLREDSMDDGAADEDSDDCKPSSSQGERGTLYSGTQSATTATAPRRLRGRSSLELAPFRLTGRHFPSIFVATENRKHARKRCVVCLANKRRKESVYCCKECNVALCVVPCFQVYHTKKTLR